MPRNKPSTTARGKYSQVDLDNAAAEIEQGGKLRTVAPKYGMHCSTLCRHMQRKRETGVLVKRNIGASTLFTSAQERELADYVKSCAKMFHGVNLAQAQKLAYSYACNLGIDFPEVWNKNKEAGVDWLSGFRNRHMDISLRVPEPTSLARVRGFNREAVGLFFDNMDEVRRKYSFTPHQIWNLDETGCMTVQKPSKVLAPKGVKQLGQVTSQERGSLVTMCCCINAAGESLPPAYIFPRVNFQHHMLKGGPPGSLGLASKSGWMTTEAFKEVLSHFIKFMRVSRESPGLLTMDNHISHVSAEVVQMAKDHGVVIITFPPHCSHRLQPLDLSVYGPFKAFYNRALSSWMRDNPGKAVTIYEIAELSNRALLKAATPENVQKGFKVSSLCPYNRDIFSDDLFVPNESFESTEVLSATVDSVPAQEDEEPTQGSSGLPRLPIIPSLPESHQRRRKRSTILAFPLRSSSEEEEDEDEPVLDDDSSSDCSISSSSTSDDEECAGEIEPGDHLVVGIKGTKASRNFIAEVTEKEKGGTTFMVCFLKKSCKGNHYIKPSDEVSQIDATQVIFKLPKATMIGGSARRKKMIQFGGAENPFNVE